MTEFQRIRGEREAASRRIERNRAEISRLYDEISALEERQATLDAQELLLLTRHVDRLTERERSIWLAYYGFRDRRFYSLNEIAGQVGVSRERVQQILNKARRKLAHLASRKPKAPDPADEAEGAGDAETRASSTPTTLALILGTADEAEGAGDAENPW